MYFCHVKLRRPCYTMHRPKRACTERAKQKIQEILAWETCTEDSTMFKAVEAQMQLELNHEKHGSDYAPSSTSESDSESDEQCSDAEDNKEEKKEEPFKPTEDE